jgi:hypothetical protein
MARILGGLHGISTDDNWDKADVEILTVDSVDK